MNYNLATNVNFKFEIPGADIVNYFVQSVDFPSITMNEIETPYKNIEMYVPGNVEVENRLSLKVLLDEDYETYFYFYEWMTSFIDENNWRDGVKDVRLDILSANKTPLYTFTFVGAFPVSLGSFSLDNSVNDTTNLTFMCDLRYQHILYKRSSG